MSALSDSGGPGQPQLEWRDGGVPVSTRFDDPYFSLSGGLAETRHVFLAGNDLPDRLHPGFHIAELGFGTVLNCLALAQIAQVPVRMTSFEAFPMDRDQMARAHAAFPELGDLAAGVRAGWGPPGIRIGEGELTVVAGGVGQTLPGWPGRAWAKMPSGPATTSSTSRPLGSMVMMTPLPSTTPGTPLAGRAPASCSARTAAASMS